MTLTGIQAGSYLAVATLQPGQTPSSSVAVSIRPGRTTSANVEITTAALGSVYVTWTINGLPAAGGMCQEMRLANVTATIAFVTRTVPCSHGSVVLPDVAAGVHTLTVTGTNASNYTSTDIISNVTVTAGQMVVPRTADLF